jgi:hypothetical protein
MTRAEMEEIAEEAAAKALTQLFLTLGIDVNDPKDVKALQEDLRYSRSLRESSAAVKQHALKTAIGVVVSGFLGWLGLIIWKGQG